MTGFGALSPTERWPCRDMLGRCSFFVELSVDISRMRVGRHFLEGGWECIILTATPHTPPPPPPPLPFIHTTKRPISAGVQAATKHSELHSQPASVNNVPNNYVTVVGLLHENVTPPPLPHCATVCKWGNSGLRTESDGAAPSYVNDSYKLFQQEGCKEEQDSTRTLPQIEEMVEWDR